MPERALNIIRGGQFMGGDLVQLKSEIHRPGFQDRVGSLQWELNTMNLRHMFEAFVERLVEDDQSYFGAIANKRIGISAY